VDGEGTIVFIADAHRDDGRRFVVRAEEKTVAFLELERVVRAAVASVPGPLVRAGGRPPRQ
jgi:hypothetical protein